MAYPDNVLHLATECQNKGHSAVFPERLPEWFIKLFTKKGDTVLDPFMGSGTTLMVSRRLGRHSIGVDIHAKYCIVAAERLRLAANQTSFFKTESDSLTSETELHAANDAYSIKRRRSSKHKISLLNKPMNKNRPRVPKSNGKLDRKSP